MFQEERFSSYLTIKNVCIEYTIQVSTWIIYFPDIFILHTYTIEATFISGVGFAAILKNMYS